MKRPIHRTKAVAAVFAAFLAALLIAGEAARRSVTSNLPEGFAVGSVVADPIGGGVSLRDIRAASGGISLAIGEIRFATSYGLVTPALAAENVTLKDVAVDTESVNYRADSIEIVGSSLGQKDVSALFDKTAAKPLSEVLATFSATSIAMPKATVERKNANGTRQVTTFDAVALRTIAGGKAATLSSNGGTTGGTPPNDATFGAISGKNIDLAQVARLLGPAPATADREAKPLYGELTIDKFQFRNAAGATMSVGRFASSDVKIMRGEQPNRGLPFYGTFSLSESQFDIPNAKDAGQKSSFSLKGVKFVTDAPVDGIPTRLLIAIDALAIAVPANSANAGMKNLADLGYTTVLVSGDAEGNWNPQNNDFTVKDVTLNVADMGIISLNGVFGKVTKSFFSRTDAISQAAAKDVTTKSLNLVVENKGLYERIVAREARKRGKSLDETRKDLSTSATLTFVTMTPASAEGRVITNAVGKFVASPKKLRISVKSKDPAGIVLSSLTDKATAQKVFPDRLDITASAD